MDGLGDQFLARARLAGDEDWDVARGDLAHAGDEASDGLGIADDAFKAELFIEAFAQLGVVMAQADRLDGVVTERAEHVQIERLFDEVVGAATDRLLGGGHIAVRGDEDRLSPGLLEAGGFEHLQPVLFPFHHQVGDHQVELAMFAARRSPHRGR